MSNEITRMTTDETTITDSVLVPESGLVLTDLARLLIRLGYALSRDQLNDYHAQAIAMRMRGETITVGAVAREIAEGDRKATD